jgi:Transposase
MARVFEAVFERVAGLDVHKAQVTGCVRIPDAAGKRVAHLAEFSTTVTGLLALADWLKSYGVTHVAMEATGVYWLPVWHILEDDFELTLCNARHVKNVPGRKTDVKDAEWLCQLMEAGLLRGSFVAPKPQRRLRALTRYRKTQIAERQREANRLHKALEDTGIKLDCVATDILGVSGRAMLDALVSGTTDPEVLAELAKGKLRAKIPTLREALQGRFEAHHALIIGARAQFGPDRVRELVDVLVEEVQMRVVGVAVDAWGQAAWGSGSRITLRREVKAVPARCRCSSRRRSRRLRRWAGSQSIQSCRDLGSHTAGIEAHRTAGPRGHRDRSACEHRHHRECGVRRTTLTGSARDSRLLPHFHPPRVAARPGKLGRK